MKEAWQIIQKWMGTALLGLIVFFANMVYDEVVEMRKLLVDIQIHVKKTEIEMYENKKDIERIENRLNTLEEKVYHRQ